MMEAGRDLNIYGGIFNQVNHDDDSGQELGTLLDFFSYKALMAC